MIKTRFNKVPTTMFRTDSIDINSIAFIHIPKTAGRYISKLLIESDIKFRKTLHTPVRFLSKIKPKTFTFAIVRNPYERFYSACKFGGYEDSKTIEDISNKLLYSRGIDWISDYSLFHFEHFFTQKHFIIDFDGNIRIKHIGRYEEIEKTIEALKEKGFDIEDRFELKPNTSSNWKEVLSKKTIENLNEIYREDFKEFKYKMI